MTVPHGCPARIGCLLAFVAAQVFFGIAFGQESECSRCHDLEPPLAGVHEGLDCQNCHGELDRSHRRQELPAIDQARICGQCHGKPAREVGRSVHAGEARCTDCHGTPHDIRPAVDLGSAISPVNQIQQCGKCHGDPPELIDGYLTGEHGKALLLSGLINAPSCSDCHGGHRIMKVDTGRAPTEHHNSPELCGSCHQILFERWKNESAHGLAWQADREGPVCVDCHSSHMIVDPTTYPARHAGAENCGGCHDESLGTFGHSFHGQALHLGYSEGATCADCHTPHRNLPADNPASSVHADNRLETCGKCHENITAAFATFDPHNDPSDPEDNYAVYVVWFLMTSLLIGVFAFFGIHDLLWLQRSLVGTLRGEFAEDRHAASGQYVRRFRRANMRMHVIIIVTFMLLALTGLPLKFNHAPWAQMLVDILGGVDSTRFLHRLAAIGTFGYLITHVIEVLYRSLVKGEKGMFWGPNSMVPQPRDVKDFLGNLRYFLYLGERPKGDRWTYFEKFDYLAVLWGVTVIGISGLFLWAPDFFTRFLPGWTLNAAHVIHSDEALLATGFIFVFHFFHTHLRPESFPMDTVIFTGKMPLSRFKAERPMEYDRLVAEGRLEEVLVPAPTRVEVRNAYMLGSIFLVIGIALAVGIIWALLAN